MLASKVRRKQSNQMLIEVLSQHGKFADLYEHKKPGRIGDLAEHASIAISSGSGRVYKGLPQAR